MRVPTNSYGRQIVQAASEKVEADPRDGSVLRVGFERFDGNRPGPRGNNAGKVPPDRVVPPIHLQNS